MSETDKLQHEQNNPENDAPVETECNMAGQEQSDENELLQLNDKFLRICAEYDNFKKRTQKEKAEIYADATADVIKAVLTVLDTIDRAAEMDGCNEGIRLIQKQLDTVLKGIGVERIKTDGEQFDPRLHDAVMHIQDESIGSNTIVEELAAGYKYKDKIIRHSIVKVAN
ncbi:MAG: nucleotide exchange factor GrpE [Firmicutes bacterium]|nr:nucleotide exchange factor GrpE [Bacillota bacterium]